MLENVPEIRTWGPLGKDDKPIKERSGEAFISFIMALTTGIPKSNPTFTEMCDFLDIDENSETSDALTRGLGYKAEWRTLRSCDYGAPTTRTRFYLIARCDGKPIVWPEPTHAPKDSEAVKQGKLKPYRTAAECIDWDIPDDGEIIFSHLKENGRRRVGYLYKL